MNSQTPPHEAGLPTTRATAKVASHRTARIGSVVIVLLVLARAVAASSPAASRPTVPVVRCPTIFGIEGTRPALPTRLTVLGDPPVTAGLAAYSNTSHFLIGPAGMNCSGIVATDGGEQTLVWPRGTRQPGDHTSGKGLSLRYEPACAGCKTSLQCPFFPALARKLTFPCRSRIPLGETVVRQNRHLVLFSDPAGLAGDGFPSGGPYPANGFVDVVGRDQIVYRATCTLPRSEHRLCTTSLNDLLDRSG